MATDFIRPPEVLEMHTEMVRKLEELFSVKSTKWNNILGQIKMLNLLPESDVGEIESMFDLFICLVQKKGNGITHGEYASIRTILGPYNTLAEEIIDHYTGRIHAFYKDVPTVMIDTESHSVNKGQPVVLKCKLIKSNTAIVDVQWKRKAKGKDTFTDIDIDGERYFGGSVQSPSLCITETREEDNEATYICQVKNAAGTGQSDEIRVKITQPEQETNATYIDPEKTFDDRWKNVMEEAGAETEIFIKSVGKLKGNRKHLLDSDSETEVEDRKSKRKTGFLALQAETSQTDSQSSSISKTSSDDGSMAQLVTIKDLHQTVFRLSDRERSLSLR